MTATAVPSLDLTRPVVVGFGITGRAVAAALVQRGIVPVVLDDRASEDARAAASSLGVELRRPGADAADQRRDLVEAFTGATVVFPAPGLPAHHQAFRVAADLGVPIASEFDLAGVWDDRPLVAITGTNGKTTVTMMVADALRRSGLATHAVGNTETPLVAAIDDPATDVFVVECSSFRLAHSLDFRPTVAAWLNFAPDHLDAHGSLEEYREAKASIYGGIRAGGAAVVAADDPVVTAAAPAATPELTVETFGLDSGDWRIADGALVGPDGPLVAVAELARSQPHDLRNAAAAAAIAHHAGADDAGIAEMLRTFAGLPHRVQFVGEGDGVRWFNDSKATVPHATLAALGGFESVVLIAGGRNKGLDLGVLADGVPPVRAVVATGDAGPEVVAAFADTGVATTTADSMAAAIAAAAEAARPGDTVLLSPSCTSFDWYPNYGARGDDFVRLVQAHLAGGATR